MLDMCVSSPSSFSVLNCGCSNTQESQKIPVRVSAHRKSISFPVFLQQGEREGGREGGTEGLRGLERKTCCP